MRRRLIWLCTVYRCPTKRTLGSFGLTKLLDNPTKKETRFNLVFRCCRTHAAQWALVNVAKDRICVFSTQDHVPSDFYNCSHWKSNMRGHFQILNSVTVVVSYSARCMFPSSERGMTTLPIDWVMCIEVHEEYYEK